MLLISYLSTYFNFQVSWLQPACKRHCHRGFESFKYYHYITCAFYFGNQSIIRCIINEPYKQSSCLEKSKVITQMASKYEIYKIEKREDASCPLCGVSNERRQNRSKFAYCHRPRFFRH